MSKCLPLSHRVILYKNRRTVPSMKVSGSNGPGTSGNGTKYKILPEMVPNTPNIPYQIFHFAAGGFFSKNSRGKHFGVIEHEEVAGSEIIGQIFKNPVFPPAGCPVKHKKSCVCPLRCRVRGNQFLRQIEIKAFKRQHSNELRRW